MIEIKDLSFRLPGFALTDISLTINSTEFYALLGPTGSGKTLLLEIIAGLKYPDSGSILLNGQDVTGMKPEQRNISIVYQDYALFPNMSVEQNINYGLRFRKKHSGVNYKSKFDLLVEMLGIQKLIKRSPQNLSGGEKQRVSLARALIVEPNILLLDEPFSALDANTKEVIQVELKKLHNTLKTTTLMVTHNFSEVFSLAEKVAIIKSGHIQQVGLTEQVFKMPNSRFVANFVGMKNIFPLSWENNIFSFGNKIQLNNDHLTERQLTNKHTDGTGYYVGLRPEDLVIGIDTLLTDYQLDGTISSVSNNGIFTEVTIEARKLYFTAYLTPNRYFELGLHEDKHIYLGFDRNNINLLEEKSLESTER